MFFLRVLCVSAARSASALMKFFIPKLKIDWLSSYTSNLLTSSAQRRCARQRRRGRGEDFNYLWNWIA